MSAPSHAAPDRVPTPISRPPSRSMNKSPVHSASSTSLAHRPQPPDSLQQRLRSTHPIPTSSPITVDVLATPSRSNTPVPRIASPDGAHVAAASSPNNIDRSHTSSPSPGLAGGPSVDIGIYPDEVYDVYLGPVIGPIRRFLIRNLKRESRWLAWHQTIVRRPNLDRYFVYTSLLGTHSFFLIFLPMAFWLGSPMLARGLVNVLAFGVYFSSAIKDLFCIPRPFSPPCTRLVIGTTHLEYGFLSTHSTNAMGVAFYLYLWLGALRSHAQSPVLDSWFWEILLGYYAISVVYGRLYAGMHSLMDCVAGSLLGAGISWVQWHFMDAIERFYILEGWTVPLVSIPATLLMVSIHPQPLDDCPCFEDAIAFIAVVLGVVLARWANCKWDLLDRNDHPLDSHWPDGPGVAEKAKQMWYGAIGISEPQPWLASLQTKGDASVLLTWALWGLKSLTALVLGVALIMAVRIATKTVCQVILPPTLRFVQDSFGVIIPRRHYFSAATYLRKSSKDKSDSKKQTSSEGGEYPAPLRYPSPSPAQASSRRRSGSLERNKIRFTLGDGSTLPVPFTSHLAELPGDSLANRIAGALSAEEKQRQQDEQDRGLSFERPENRTHADKVRHYDADVLAKVIVYAMIGFAASCPIRLVLIYLGLTSP